MRRFLLALMALLVPCVTEIVSASNESTTIELSFDAADQTPYVLETAADIVTGTMWVPLTNVPDASSRAVQVTVPATGGSRYFRLASLGAGGGAPLTLHIAIPRAFTTNSAVLPAGNENSFGNGFNNVFFRGPINYQTFYGRSNLTNLKNHRITITGMAFRLDEGPETTRVDAWAAKVEIWLSTFTKPAFIAI